MFSARGRRILRFAPALALALGACAVPASDRAPRDVQATTSHDAPVAAPGDAPSTAPLVDDFGDTLRLAQPAQRIVSLNPVTTEAMFALGSDARLIGRTKWDASPPQVRRIPDLGDGLQPNVEAVLAARPDLVVLYAAEANRTAAAAFRRAGVQTLSMRTDRIADLARALRALGIALGDSAAAQVVADSVRRSLNAVRARAPRQPSLSVFWYAWPSPIITIGAGSYLDELIALAGARNVFGDLTQPSPQVSLESVAQRNPDVIFAGPIAARRLRGDARWQSVRAVREGRVFVFDTSLVGRPGVRLGEGARSLRALLDSAARTIADSAARTRP
ncbi:MAG: helical backbone metal receptor [Gemmatimonadaceae bacterium]|nr:helical backbone metal receptor [Gemmatimonadaceae bacterium]